MKRSISILVFMLTILPNIAISSPPPPWAIVGHLPDTDMQLYAKSWRGPEAESIKMVDVEFLVVEAKGIKLRIYPCGKVEQFKKQITEGWEEILPNKD